MTFDTSDSKTHKLMQDCSLLIDAEVDVFPTILPHKNRTWLLLIGLICIAFNLRPALSSLSTVLSLISRSVGLSSLMAGFLTTLPVLCLGFFAPIAPMLARTIGSEKTIFWVLLLLGLGITIRSLFGIPGLFGGSLITGASIGLLGVLLPGIIKRDFPEKIGQMTGIYTMALSFGAAAAAGLTVPLTTVFKHDWRYGLIFWALPAFIAALVWLPQTHSSNQARAQHYRVTGLLRDPLAWYVTAFMGLQSSLAYIVFGWLPSILIDRGLTPVIAGLVLSVAIMTQIISAMVGASLATRHRDQRWIIVIVVGFISLGLASCLYAPLSLVWISGILLGFGQGACFSIALTLIVLRSKDAHVAAQLSSMSQGFGYTFASLGPLLTGLIHQLTGSWVMTGPLFLVISIGILLAGLGAGRALFVKAQITPVV